jgi:class 3 adenylate cyclase
MILSGIIMAVTLTVTSIKIIKGGEKFTQVILEENRTCLVNTLRFGHGVMDHLGKGSHENLIDLALKSNFIRYLSIIGPDGTIIAQSDPLKGLDYLKKHDFSHFKDGEIVEETEEILLVTYKAETTVATEKHKKHHETMSGRMGPAKEPDWFIVGLDTSIFKRHFRDMVLQTIGTGVALLLFGALMIFFLGIIQRYELANLSIERLQKIKRLLGNFVPEAAKNIIEKDPEKMGLLNKYIRDATVLFLDIEGFTLLQSKYSQEKINRTIETYFSAFFNLIRKYDGDINETAGDGMMVIFLDVDSAQHARNAVRTSLEIRNQCQKISEQGSSDLFPILVNIGIHSGEVFLGSTKMSGTAAERWTFTASGPVTILAARLADHANNGQILLGEETARRLEKLFPMNRIGKVPLKNIKDSGEVYEITVVDAVTLN